MLFIISAGDKRLSSHQLPKVMVSKIAFCKQCSNLGTTCKSLWKKFINCLYLNQRHGFGCDRPALHLQGSNQLIVSTVTFCVFHLRHKSLNLSNVEYLLCQCSAHQPESRLCLHFSKAMRLVCTDTWTKSWACYHIFSYIKFKALSNDTLVNLISHGPLKRTQRVDLVCTVWSRSQFFSPSDFMAVCFVDNSGLLWVFKLVITISVSNVLISSRVYYYLMNLVGFSAVRFFNSSSE